MCAEDQTHATEIPIDVNNDNDRDSSFEEELTTESTTSLNDSILNYRTLHGRRYHNFKSSEYWGPNDESQNEQLDIGHHMLTLLLGGELFLAPIGHHPQNVIDVGTGTGIWAMDFADKFPSAQVVGTDLSGIQPNWVPPNCKFELDDAQLEWTFPPEHFDFVHLRCLMGSIKDWPYIYSEIYRCMKPGGWIEHVDMDIEFKSDDGSVGEGHIMQRWSKTFIDCGEQMGRTFLIGKQAKGLLEAAGFVNVVEKKYKVPVGSWPSNKELKNIGQYNLLYCVQGLEGWALWILTTILKWSYEEIQVFIAQMRSALLRRANHSYYEVYVVYGQKPEGKAKEVAPNSEGEEEPSEAVSSADAPLSAGAAPSTNERVP
ncbi:S-adenosyl-L-methionine-dependent methyltransferase [Hyaloscypha variabilis]